MSWKLSSPNSWKTNLCRVLILVAVPCIVASCSATGTSFVYATPSSDHGMIYIYRPGKSFGSGAAQYVNANGVRIGTLYNNGYIPYEARPGSLTLSINIKPNVGTVLFAGAMAPEELITIPVESHEVYFVRFKLTSSGSTMELVDNSTGQSEIRDLKMCDHD